MNRAMNAFIGAAVLYCISEVLTTGKDRKIRQLERDNFALKCQNTIQSTLIEVLTKDEKTSK